MLKLFSPSDARDLREFLGEASYTTEEFRKRPMLGEPPSRRSGNWPYLLDYTREACTLNVLLRLFVFGMSLERRAVAEFVSPRILEIMTESGMLVPGGDLLMPAVMLTPLDQYWFAADPLWRLESEQCSDLVLWPNPTTRMLNLFSTRRPSPSTLDLGAGCGVLSVLASPYSGRVAATDLNPRAAEFTQFNARLNGVENIESRTGDTFDPAKDQAFDLILANPPFFVTPTSSQLYCENPMELDEYCRRVVREGAQHLNENGYLQMTLEWVQVRGQSWQDRLAEWLEGTGCDAWILRSYVHEPASYAYERIKDEYTASPEKATKKFKAWVDYYRQRGVDEVCGGALAMRRRSGQNWLRIEEVRLDVREPFGDDVLGVFATQTLLSAHPTDEQLLSLRPRLASSTLLEQQFRPGEGRWASASLKLSLSHGLPGSLAVEPQVAEFLATFDGRLTLGELAQRLAQQVKAPAEQVRQQCCAVVRKLAGRRLIVL